MFELFLFDFFDNCSLPGAQVGEIRCVGYRCGRKIAPKSSGGALGAPQEAFLAASVADRLVHTFLEASGVHFGSHFGLKNALLLILLSGPVGPLFYACSLFATRVP